MTKNNDGILEGNYRKARIRILERTGIDIELLKDQIHNQVVFKLKSSNVTVPKAKDFFEKVVPVYEERVGVLFTEVAQQRDIKKYPGLEKDIEDFGKYLLFEFLYYRKLE